MVPLDVLAHQGGWDEIVLVGAPVLVFAGLLLLARSRAQTLADQRDAHEREAAEREAAENTAAELGESDPSTE